MVTIQANCIRTIPVRLSGVAGVTFNGTQLVFLTCRECVLFDCEDFQEVQRICLPREYSGICYDPRNQCYWMLGACEAMLYQLDTCFNELCKMPIRGTYQQRVNGISCDCLRDGLWFSYPSGITFMELPESRISSIQNEDKNRINLGILATGCCRVVSCLAGGKQFIEATCPGNCERVEFCIPQKYRLIGMLPCTCHSKEPETKGCHCKIHLLLTERCSCNLVLMECNITIHSSGDECCCEKNCHSRYCIDDCCRDCGRECGCRESICCAKYEIMHSIALEEAGISHILNAEGEKLQKAVATASSIDQLLCVNESVKRTLTQITLLEGQLYSKLEALQCGSCGGGCAHFPCGGDEHFPCGGNDDCPCNGNGHFPCNEGMPFPDC